MLIEEPMDNASSDEPFTANAHPRRGGLPLFELTAPDPRAYRRLVIGNALEKARVVLLGGMALPFVLGARAVALLYALAPGLFSIGCVAFGGWWGYQHSHNAVGAVLGALTGIVVGGVILPFVPALLTLALMLAIAAAVLAIFKS
jgi:hypothetical protein